MPGHATADPILTVRGASVRFGAKEALSATDLDLRRGQITAILGPSGAGKSTLLRAIAGFQSLSDGTIALGGKTLTDGAWMMPAEQRGIGMVVQDLALFPHLTAWRNVAFGVRSKDRRAIAQDWLARIGLADRTDAFPHELSGGEQQRVALARALAPDPSVVLLDEAFSSLDPELRRLLRRETEALLRQSGAAVLMVTHDPDEAMEMADDLAVMAGGEVLQRGTPYDLYWSPADAVVGSLLGEINVLEGRVEGGIMRTAFGEIAAAGISDGTTLQALVRPSAIAVTPSAEETGLAVARSSFRGAETWIAVENARGQSLLALAARGAGPGPGQSVSLAIDPGRISLVRV